LLLLPRALKPPPSSPPNPPKTQQTDISRVQDDEVGDGTTSVVVLAGELLREAEQLVGAKVHPTTIIAGYREAAQAAEAALKSGAFDHKGDEALLRGHLTNVARTTLSSKILTGEKEHFAKLAVDAVLRLKGRADLDAIQVIKKPGGALKVRTPRAANGRRFRRPPAAPALSLLSPSRPARTHPNQTPPNPQHQPTNTPQTKT
jgi:hypothetical protein